MSKVSSNIQIVTGLWTTGRQDRSIKTHYLASLARILGSSFQVEIGVDSQSHKAIRAINTSWARNCRLGDKQTEAKMAVFQAMLDQNLSSMEKKLPYPLSSPDYLAITLRKLAFLRSVCEVTTASRVYWIDAGIFSSFPNFPRLDDAIGFMEESIPEGKIGVPTFLHLSRVGHVHGFPTKQLFYDPRINRHRVTRASFFGGDVSTLIRYIDSSLNLAKNQLENGFVFTEEVAMTFVTRKYPQFITELPIPPSGDVGRIISSMDTKHYFGFSIEELILIFTHPFKIALKI